MPVKSSKNKKTEKDIKEAYDLSQKVALALSLKRQEEKELIERRNELERLMRNSKDVLKKSEILETKVSVALEYLTSGIFDEIEDFKQKKVSNYDKTRRNIINNRFSKRGVFVKSIVFRKR